MVAKGPKIWYSPCITSIFKEDMKNKFLFLGAVIVGSFFIWQFSTATNSDIVINEIGAYESSGYEWVEIYNKGSDLVDLLQWKFWEQGTNHGLSVSTTDSLVDSGEYAVICQDAEKFLEKYSGFAGSVFDSSWSTLNESGEEVGLKDGDGNFIEQFTYISAGDYSLERKNPFLNDYTSDNWQEHISGNTIGLINSIFSTGTVPSDPPTTTTSTDPGTDPPTTTPTSTVIIDTTTLWQNIKINEFACAPQGDENEWVEFFNNNTSSLDLSGGYLCDERGSTSTASCKIISGMIGTSSWFLFDLDTRSFLNNDGDSVILRNSSGEEIDKIIYTGELIPKTGQSLARKTDGQDTGSDTDWAITTSMTKNSTNTIIAPVVSSGGGGSYTPPVVVIETPVAPVLSQTSDKIILNELYPDPVGSDTLDEFIEIKNIGLETVNLAGWTLSDTVKKYVLTGDLGPGQLAVYKREKTGIALNNSTPEEVKLADYSGKVVDSVSYKYAPEGQSYAKTVSGTWAWTTEITLSLENKVVIVDSVGITVNIISPSTAEIGEMVIFNASESLDKRGGQLSFLWSFSDNSTSTGEEVGHVFTTSGVFTVKLTATSTSGGAVDKSVNIRVGLDLLEAENGVIISEVFPNPDGADKGEFIELYNMEEIGVDLSGWQLKNKNGKTYTIPDGTMIGPKSFLVFYQEVTKLTLTNTEDKITLLNGQNEVMDLVKYEKAPSGQSWSYFDGKWFWSEDINPGRLVENTENNITDKTVSKSSASKTYQIKNLSDARESEVKDLVITQGTVAVLPGVFGTQYIYITDGEVGLQVYNFKKDWPELKIGDKVKVIGEISQASGVKRIKTKTKNEIVRIGFIKPTIVEIKTLDSLEETNLGALIKISGEITAIKTSVIYLDDGSSEATVYLKKNTKIDKKKYKVGQILEVTGILETSNSGLQVWPRGVEDLVVTDASVSGGEALQTDNPAKETANNYITATLGGFSALFFGLFWKNKGTVIKGTIALAGKLIKKG